MPLTDPRRVSVAEARTNRLAWRLSNTSRPLADLLNDGRAILLENALIDSSRPVTFTFPKNLQPAGDPGACIVQSVGPASAAFRSLLGRAGAQIVAYIPNNAYLVRLPAGGAGGLAAQPGVQAVLPYEPYYKIQLALLGAAVNREPLGAGTLLNLGLFAEGAARTLEQIEAQPGVRVVARERSPFGPVARVQLAAGADWTALAALPGVQIVEPFHRRVSANDLSRVTVGIATNTTVPTNYLNLTGLNVLVAVNDSGIDATHPDFSTGGSATGGPGGAPVRVIGDAVQSLVDTNGHGTSVAGIIAGNGAKSYSTMAGGAQMAEGSVSNADFRGKAPMARLYSIGGVDGGADTNAISDQYFQEQAALTNALIDNNSWGYGGDNTYDLAAASYDWATRDALPEVMGSQPVLFVFAAGNDGYLGQNGGNGDNKGGSTTAGTITSPGTAKDVITVTALEQLRNITNIVTDVKSNMSPVWQPQTDTGYQVASYSARGNVGVGIEGPTGRFKPDVAAPGTFVVSTRSAQWDTNAYYHPTNYTHNPYSGQSVAAGSVQYYGLLVPANAVGVTVRVVANNNSPQPFPGLPVYVSQYGFPDPADPSTYDFMQTSQVLIPPDGPANYLTTIQGTGFNFAVANTNSQAISYNVFTEVASTNDLGDYYPVLEGMNDGLGGYYRYESGTSMAAADVSGTLALIQDFFTNQLQLIAQPGAAQGDDHQRGAAHAALLQLPGRQPGQQRGLGPGQPAQHAADQQPGQLQRHRALAHLRPGPEPDQRAGHRREPFVRADPGDEHLEPAIAPDAGLDGPARRPGGRHQAGQQPATGGDEPGRPGQPDGLLRQQHCRQRLQPGSKPDEHCEPGHHQQHPEHRHPAAAGLQLRGRGPGPRGQRQRRLGADQHLRRQRHPHAGLRAQCGAGLCAGDLGRRPAHGPGPGHPGQPDRRPEPHLCQRHQHAAQQPVRGRQLAGAEHQCRAVRREPGLWRQRPGHAGHDQSMAFLRRDQQRNRQHRRLHARDQRRVHPLLARDALALADERLCRRADQRRPAAGEHRFVCDDGSDADEPQPDGHLQLHQRPAGRGVFRFGAKLSSTAPR